MSGHTPGPWLQSDYADSRAVYALTPDGKHNRFWLSVQSDGRAALGEAAQSECIANAHLIAAAPDLLDELGYAVEHLAANLGEDHPRVIGARAAIAKAEGSA